MNWNWKQHRQEKSLFRSYYCANCRQQKPCQLLTSWSAEYKSYCCACYYQGEQERAKEYSSYQSVYQQKVKERKAEIRQLQLLKDYRGCSQCGSLEVDAYSLYVENKLVCQPCLVRKIGWSSSPISFWERSKSYKKWYGIDLAEQLSQSLGLPVNYKCKRELLKDKAHLSHCQCLEKEAWESYQLFTNSLKNYQAKLKDCVCEKSEKVRVEDDYHAECKKCKKTIPAASKKRVIKNRNDPQFWGLKVKEKVLCGDCLESQKEKMTPLRRAKFNEYKKLGRL